MVTKKVLRENGMLSMKWLWDMLRVPTRVGRVIERGLEKYPYEEAHPLLL